MEASTEGVLGGYGCVNDADVKGSDAFLRPLLAERFGTAKRHLVALGEFITAWRLGLVLVKVRFYASFVVLISFCGSSSVYRILMCSMQCSFFIFQTVADCGSGIGRVTKNFLLRHFNEVCNLSSLRWFEVML